MAKTLHAASVRLIAAATALVWIGSASAQTAHPPDTMQARLLACAACHGEQGQGTSNDYFPRLASKPAQYLYNQLLAFRQGRRRYPPMNYLLEYQTDDYLHDMAGYFAALRLPPQPASVPPASPAMLDRGEWLVRNGAADRGVPPCSACHGANLTGMEPAIPGLIGLKANYISAQLGAWRYGTRTAADPDCMQIVAGHLTEADVTAVAAYLSSLPVPPNAAPLPANAMHLPLRCGSEPQ